MKDQEDLLAYYRSEMAYLRQAGQGFAQKYPKVAERLELSAEGSSDPHVERLIESFAFLTARIQRRLNDEFPEVTNSLLGILYPHLVQPIPPMSIARFLPDPARGKLTTGHLVPRHTSLFSQTADGLTCRFRTAYPVTLWPLRIRDAQIEAKSQFDFLDAMPGVASVLRLKIEAQSGTLKDLNLKQLRFHINGDAQVTGNLYELIFSHTQGVYLFDEEQQKAVLLPKNSLQPVGFALDEDVIPYSSQSHPAYRLLQEYFSLPEKYLFFDVSSLDKNPSARIIDILFPLDIVPRDRQEIPADTFVLGCTPIINLFQRTSEPIRLDHTQSEYRLVADLRRERTMEVHTVLSVSSSSNPGEEEKKLRPLYAISSVDSDADHQSYWYARRETSQRTDYSGTEVYLSFVDLSFDPSNPPNQTIYAHMVCTNRDLALQLPENAMLQMEDTAPVAHIHFLRKPTPTGYPPLGGSSRWALISNLALNYLSLEDDPSSLDTFKRTLKLYSLSDTAAIHRQIDGIRGMKSRKISRSIYSNGWRGFCQGREISMLFDEQCYVGGNVFLFASMISRFLGMYASVNSFTQLEIERLHLPGEKKRFPVVVGTEPVL